MKQQIDYKKFLARPVGAELLILDTESGEMYQFNESASLIWQALERGGSPASIAMDLTKTYKISSDRAQAEVEQFIGQLLEI